MSIFSSLLDKWDALDPDKQSKLKIAGAIGILLVLAIGVSKVSKKDGPRYERTKIDSTMMLPESSKMDLESLHAEQFKQNKDLEKLKAQQDASDKAWEDRFKRALDDAKKNNQLGNPNTDEEINRLRAQLEQEKRGRGDLAPAPALDNGLPSPNMGASYTPQFNNPQGAQAPQRPMPQMGGNLDSAQAAEQLTDPVEPEAEVGIRISSGSGRAGGGSDGGSSSSKKKGNKQTYLPAGSIIQGVLLSGVDAPTSAQAQKNPTPIIIRVKRDAILPNFFSADIRECFIIASAYGVMSTERANIRTETVSCVQQNGAVVNAGLQGYGIGDDGKAGLRGRLVTKQGAMVARSIMAGLFGGIADAAKPMAINSLSTSPGSTTSYQSPDISDVLASGVGEGTATAMNQVSKFYLDMAKEMFPVIEIDAGRNIEVVLIKATNLKAKEAEQDKRMEASPISNTGASGMPQGNEGLKASSMGGVHRG